MFGGDWLIAWAIAWCVIRGFEALRAEYTHTRDRYATGLAREHADWSPRRVHRNARRRARGYWWSEISAGWPTWKAAWAEDKLVAQLALEKALAAGARRRADLKRALEEIQAERKAARDAGKEPPEPEPGTGRRWTPRILPGGGEPAKGTTPEPPAPEPAPAPDGPMEPAAPEPPAAGDPGTAADAAAASWEEPLPAAPWTVQEDELLGSGRCIRQTGTGEEGPTYCAMPVVPGEIHCPAHDGAPPPDGSTEKTPGVLLGEPPPTDGGQVTTAEADLETGDSAYQAMLSFLEQGRKEAAQAGSANCDAVDAAASATGLSRPPAVAAALAAVKDAEQAREAAYANARKAVIASHEAGDEYNKDGLGANREAFTRA